MQQYILSQHAVLTGACYKTNHGILECELLLPVQLCEPEIAGDWT